MMLRQACARGRQGERGGGGAQAQAGHAAGGQRDARVCAELSSSAGAAQLVRQPVAGLASAQPQASSQLSSQPAHREMPTPQAKQSMACAQPSGRRRKSLNSCSRPGGKAAGHNHGMQPTSASRQKPEGLRSGRRRDWSTHYSFEQAASGARERWTWDGHTRRQCPDTGSSA